MSVHEQQVAVARALFKVGEDGARSVALRRACLDAFMAQIGRAPAQLPAAEFAAGASPSNDARTLIELIVHPGISPEARRPLIHALVNPPAPDSADARTEREGLPDWVDKDRWDNYGTDEDGSSYPSTVRCHQAYYLQPGVFAEGGWASPPPPPAAPPPAPAPVKKQACAIQ